ncbi:MAG: prolyl-tRNA synthetase associated domain-containing protein [Candidatus Magasanikbacteria bacterium]|nr:prolyl-tRNA synthetase associated domain-containing protein [Candidatus Magasanikbacteria bacterium]
MTHEVEQFLDLHKIQYKLHTHPAVFTCEEAETHCKDIPGLACKNLFLKEDKTGQYFLVILPADKRMNLKDFQSQHNLQKLSFARDERLAEVLKLTPGAVSPFGLINDSENKTVLYIDAVVWNAPIVTFHPNVNTETLELTHEMFKKCVEGFGNEYKIV